MRKKVKIFWKKWKNISTFSISFEKIRKKILLFPNFSTKMAREVIISRGGERGTLIDITCFDFIK